MQQLNAAASAQSLTLLLVVPSSSAWKDKEASCTPRSLPHQPFLRSLWELPERILSLCLLGSNECSWENEEPLGLSAEVAEPRLPSL